MKCKDCKHLKKKKEAIFGLDTGTETHICVLLPTHVSVYRIKEHFCDQFEKNNNKTLDEKE